MVHELITAVKQGGMRELGQLQDVLRTLPVIDLICLEATTPNDNPIINTVIAEAFEQQRLA